ncbi:hypothetical protein SAMN04487916_11379 [Arthrobacter sp. ov407]|uniref:hypothetical protein n=1 Tax=Arthrobacter sp. ov407 TaxID=1761748 RepID=UPI00087F0693|nr:hypothetical protein [Arthrobacter sp. ov407]SDL72301.1 hypothetical protein SAMN04487916_11379 [Arthrobacter sp. ov407]
MRSAALLLAVACTAAGLAGCEYKDDVTDPTAAPTRAGRPTRSLTPPVDPGLAEAEQRNLGELEAVLGTRPAGLVLGGTGGIGGSGFRNSAAAVPKGTYTLTAACIGAPNALLTVSQDGLRGGGRAEMNLDCGAAETTRVELRAGPVQIQGFRPGTDPAAGEVAGFWIVPAAPGS